MKGHKSMDSSKTGLALMILSVSLLFVSAGKIRSRDSSIREQLLRVPLIERTSPLKSVRLHNSGEPTVRIEAAPFFVGRINLGSPKQTFNVAFDTIASDLWIQSVECSNCHNGRYNSSKSTTYRKNGRQVDSILLAGDLKGFLSVDLLSIGDATIHDQAFAEITSLTQRDDFNAGPDGFFGLGFSRISFDEVVPPLGNMLIHGVIKHKVVSLYQNTNSMNVSSSGEVIFGGVDSTKFTGEITYAPVFPVLWSFMIGQISFNTKEGEVIGCHFFGCVGWVNSASPMTKGPKKYIKALNEAIGAKELFPGTDIYQLPSCDVSELPDLKFTVSGKAFAIKPHDYVIGAFDESSKQKICLSSLVGTAMPEDGFFWILGDAFIGTSYTVLDYESNRIGFAPLK